MYRDWSAEGWGIEDCYPESDEHSESGVEAGCLATSPTETDIKPTTICENCGIEFEAEIAETCGICGATLCPECVCEDCEQG